VNDSADTLNSTPAESWFVATDVGAVEYHLDALKSEIKQGRVHLSTLVWRNGMQAWVELEQVPLLRMLVTVRPSPVLGDTPSEPVTPVATVSADLLDDLTDDKTTVLESEVQSESTVTPLDPDSTSIFKGLFDNPTLAGQAGVDFADGDISDVVADSDISDASDVVADSDINDDALGLLITESVFPVTTKSSDAAADFSDTKTTETAEAGQPQLGRPFAGHTPDVQDSPRRPAAEFASQKPKSHPSESIQPIIARPATPRVSLAGISTRPAETRPLFQAPKREPISEGLARSAPTRVFSEKPVSAVTPVATPKPLYTPLIQPTAPVPTMRPAPPARTRPSILPPLSPLPVTEPHNASATRTAVASPTIAPKPKLEHQPTLGPAESADTSEPTIIGMPSRIETIRAPAEPEPFGMQPYVKPSHSASTESTFIGMPPRLEPSLAPPESDQAALPLSYGDATGDSIYPSISSIHPALRRSRNVRRTLIIIGAVGAAAAASVIFAFTYPEHEQLSTSTLSAQARAGSNAAVIPATQTAEHPAAKSPEVPRQESAAAADKPVAANAQAIKSRGSDTHAPASVQPVADDKIASANSGTRPHSSRVTRSSAGVMPVTTKSPPLVGGQPSRNKATPTADWDQGTVEKRAWMSPGF